ISTSTPSPTTFDSFSLRLRRSGFSSKTFLPVPRITGKTIRLIWSTRSLSISSCTSRWLPGTCSSPSNSSFSLRTWAVASPLSRTVVLFHSGSLSVVEMTNFGIALNLSANSPSRFGLPRLIQLELIPIVSAVELEGPTRVLESRLAPRRLHDAVERYELRHHDPCCHQSISFTPTRRLQTPADSQASPFAWKEKAGDRCVQRWTR